MCCSRQFRLFLKLLFPHILPLSPGVTGGFHEAKADPFKPAYGAEEGRSAAAVGVVGLAPTSTLQVAPAPALSSLHCVNVGPH